MREKIKYISINRQTGNMGRKYHIFPDCSSSVGNELSEIRDDQLKDYGITEECKICQKRRNKNELK